MKLSETTRGDGLRIVTARVPSKRVHFDLVAHVGSAYDPEDKRGLFHYFEHMAFKGTHERSVSDIRAFAQRNLLHNNASTGRTETRYYGEAVYKKAHHLIGLLCDLYCNSTFPADEVEREKEVVLNEIARDNDQDNYVAYFGLWEQLWKENPLRVFGVGSPDGVKSVTKGDLQQAQARWYVPSNTLAIAIGNIRHEEFVAELNKHIPHDTRSVSHLSWGDEYNEPPQKTEVIIEKSQREKATLVYGCKFPLYTDERDYIVSKFLEWVLVTGASSLLWTELREKRGLAYSVGGGVSTEHPLGAYFSVYVEALPSRLDEVRELIPSVLFQPFTDEAVFEETREHLYDWYTLGYDEGQSSWSSLIRRAAQGGKSLKKLERYFERHCKIISSVSLDEMEQMRVATLEPEKFVTVIIQPS
ncbi:MAG: pitrilysin family protein [Patescibacteria group bacterium]|nr:pitrilysin family protein [Patescibacteria group bacterium]